MVPISPGPSRESLYNLYCNKELSMKQVSEKLKIGKTTVRRRLKKYEIKTRSSPEGQKLRLQRDGKFGGYLKDKLTELQKELLIGTLLGDGTLYLGRRNTNARLKIQHSEKDNNYLEYKYSILNSFVTGTVMRDVRFNKNMNKNYSSRTFITVTHPEFTRFHKFFYRDGKKIVDDKILKMVTPFGLAVWIMDDGYYNKQEHFIDLYTMNFTLEEHLLVKKWFKNKFKVIPSIEYHKQADKYYLRFNVFNTRRLVDIIRPHVISSMERKVGATR